VPSLVPGHLGSTSPAGGTARHEKSLVPCLGLKSGTLGGTARHESLFVTRHAVPSRAVTRHAWAGSCRAAHLAIYIHRLQRDTGIQWLPCIPIPWFADGVSAGPSMYEHVKARPGGRRQPMLRAEGQAATSDQKPSRVVVKDFKSSDERVGRSCINSPCSTL